MLGCGDSRGQGLVVGWAGGSCCNGGYWFVHLCAGCGSFSLYNFRITFDGRDETMFALDSFLIVGLSLN